MRILLSLIATTLCSAAWAAEHPLEFYRDVEPIMRGKCMACHHTGGMSPFSLVEYRDVARKLRSISKAVGSGEMPPWPPGRQCGEFKDDRSLAPDQVVTLMTWLKQGARAGTPDVDYKPPVFNDSWTTKPDEITAPGKPFTPPTDQGMDYYQCFVLPAQYATEKYIIAQEYQIPNNKIVHHLTLYLDASGKSVDLLDPKDPDGGYKCGMGAVVPGAVPLGGWTPGGSPMIFPEGTGFQIPAGSRLVMQVHYSFVSHDDHNHHLQRATGSEPVQGGRIDVGLTYAKAPIARPYRTRLLAKWTKTYGPGSPSADYFEPIGEVTDLFIPAGATAHASTQEVKLKKSIRLSHFTPHMHLLGKNIRLEAFLPNVKDSQCLIQVVRWDFDWQGSYFLKNQIDLPAGTVLRLSGVHDNSDSNPRQFNFPPKDVGWGPGSQDEMLLAFIGFTEN